jgi:hypothetical protein
LPTPFPRAPIARRRRPTSRHRCPSHARDLTT